MSDTPTLVVTLPESGLLAGVRISHEEEFKVTGRLANGHELFSRFRVTKIRVNLSNGTTWTAKSTCCPSDNFCRSVGRRLAAQGLLKQFRTLGTHEHPYLSRRDRAAIFEAICPEYKQPHYTLAKEPALV